MKATSAVSRFRVRVKVIISLGLIKSLEINSVFSAGDNPPVISRLVTGELPNRFVAPVKVKLKSVGGKPFP